VAPIRTNLTAEQAKAFQRLAWDVRAELSRLRAVRGGRDGGRRAAVSPAPLQQSSFDDQEVTLSSSTPGALVSRYTLDGTAPTRMRGYVYCGVIDSAVRPGMQGQGDRLQERHGRWQVERRRVLRVGPRA